MRTILITLFTLTSINLSLLSQENTSVKGIPECDRITSLMHLADYYSLHLVFIGPEDNPDYSPAWNKRKIKVFEFAGNERMEKAFKRYFKDTGLLYETDKKNSVLFVCTQNFEDKKNAIMNAVLNPVNVEIPEISSNSTIDEIAGTVAKLCIYLNMNFIKRLDVYGDPSLAERILKKEDIIPAKSFVITKEMNVSDLIRMLSKKNICMGHLFIYNDIPKNEWQFVFYPKKNLFIPMDELKEFLEKQDITEGGFRTDRNFTDYIKYPVTYYSHYYEKEFIELLKRIKFFGIKSDFPDIKFCIWELLLKNNSFDATKFLLHNFYNLPPDQKWLFIDNLPDQECFNGKFKDRINKIRNEYSEALKNAK